MSRKAIGSSLSLVKPILSTSPPREVNGAMRGGRTPKGSEPDSADSRSITACRER
jgi:hypothetical protein